MAPTTKSAIKLRATPLAKKIGNSVMAVPRITKKPQITNVQKKATAKAKAKAVSKAIEIAPVPALEKNSQNTQVTTNAQSKVKAKPKEKPKAKLKAKPKAKPKAKVVKTPPVPPVAGLRRSARERCPANPYNRSLISSDNLKVTKPKSKANGKSPDWANPKSEHWDVIQFLLDDSQLPVTNLDAHPPKGKFSFIVNNSHIRDSDGYRPDNSINVSIPKPKKPQVHPKLQAHIKNGTVNPSLRLYYAEYEPGQILPIAGRLFDDNQLPPARLKRRRPFPQSYDDDTIAEILKPAPKRIKLTLKATSKPPSEKVSKKLQKKAAAIELEKKIYYDREKRRISEVRERPTKTTKQILPSIPLTNEVFDERDFNYLQEENFHIRPSINIVIPDHIKAILVDDWENVTKSQQLVPLPHKKSVTQILDDWLEFEKPKRPVGSAQADILEEIVAGLKEYFERCLGRILLYRFERQQYTDFRQMWDDETSEQKCASDTYGAEHLCRLLVTLPELVAQTNMDLQSVNRLREELGKLTNWIGKNAKDYFVNEYETPGAEYVDKARSNN
ncbi:hypothetical protein EYC84_011080 [Monilinia fructicola]|uniref:Chromatin modification-related protein EAF3 n=1 Tax=Monilinia fructicola TaxID=38448 RepID=A0A5M9JBX8_MONFR|nr:hypothetical protein EYC84_011080 [Monilinia fructicola]